MNHLKEELAHLMAAVVVLALIGMVLLIRPVVALYQYIAHAARKYAILAALLAASLAAWASGPDTLPPHYTPGDVKLSLRLYDNAPAPRYTLRRAVWGGLLTGISGAAWGTHEAISHHWHAFERATGANPDYWNPAVSWRNKYRNGNPEEGPAFPGATNVFVVFTDAKHMLATVHRSTLFAGAVVVSIGDRRPVWHYLVDFGLSALCFVGGFHATYSLLFR